MNDSDLLKWFAMPQHDMARKLRSLADDIDAISDGEDMSSSPVAIQDWSMAARYVPCLEGRVTGHPAIADGSTIISSELFHLDADRGIARTLSRWYQLGSRVEPKFRNSNFGVRQ